MKGSKKPNKPRDPFFRHMVTRKSGVHTKSKKAIRAAEKVQIKKDYFCKAA